MTRPEDARVELPDGNMVKAVNAMYDFKQSAMEWYNELRRMILDGKRTSRKYSECLYYLRVDDGLIVVFATYFDEIVIVRDYTEEIKKILKNL